MQWRDVVFVLKHIANAGVLWDWLVFKFILYISKVSEQCDDRQMTNILVTSRSNNARNAVTGMLVRSDSAFLQYIEG